ASPQGAAPFVFAALRGFGAISYNRLQLSEVGMLNLKAISGWSAAGVSAPVVGLVSLAFMPLLAGLPAFAQEPAPQPETSGSFGETIEVTVVNVEVYVT